MATRRQVRETVVSLLYSVDLGNEDAAKHADTVFEERKIRNKQREFGKHLFESIISNLTVIDEKLQGVMKDWELERVGSIEKAVLRLGAYEILFENQDKAVVINEAVELGKLFGAENSAKFINGVLDAVAKGK
ncbi:MAG: transcription antitermination factor NusB [Campylobacterales bacterium]